jgi:hypothetical protein
MEWWMFVLGFIGLGIFLVVFAVIVVFLEAAFSNWDEDEFEDYNDSDDLDAILRKKNYGD